ncbi:hypothetical protein GTP58_24370 [Duganella sp. CY15W]|uniref:hypothetical protein n=1 Tax=Duganella sp. CY15W TaxID=2692172 RepID=UPI00136B6E03|nr:hypothetical protein [Duganella sp. CY15W]MYM31473.1 hypothetical protein [Duganella sp. CY15W]
MYSKIIQWRWLGLKRPENDILNDPGVFGEVTMAYGNGHKHLNVCRHGYTNESKNVLMPLWDAVCIGKGPRDELWRGYQRAKLPHGLGITTVVQEWHIEHISLYPPAGETPSYPHWKDSVPSDAAVENDAIKKSA